jgi:ribosomal protein S18 acetylase RimI-like enzyme
VSEIDPAALESHQQLIDVWRTLVSDADPDADLRELPGITMLWADSLFTFWRAATLTDIGAGPDLLATRLREASAIMRSKPVSGLLWVFEDLLTPDAAAALPAAAQDAGLTLAFSGVGQAGDILPVADPVHPDLTFERVTTPAQLQAYADLNSRAYGFPLDEGRSGLCGSLPLWRDRLHAYLGIENGVPVTAAATLPCDGRLFVLLVATAPEAQRRGFGEAVTRKALHEGGRATGLRRATLHATAAGAPVYPRIGFESNTRIHFFST